MNDELLEALAGFEKDPLGYVYWAFPWGEPGELENASGPEQWQIDLLTQLRDGLVNIEEALRLARTSGHGIGKSACVSWIIMWAISTFEDTKGVVTANTENQLKTKTWAELAKWYRLCINRGMFKMTATALFSVDEEHEKTWRIDMVPWSERNTEAFAGLHNQGKRILVVFDEGSAIPDVIYEVTEGALTDRHTQIIWCLFGNPTRNKGRFRDAFPGGKFAHRWRSAAIDSREVSLTDKKQIAQWIKDYGEDHDFVRVRVRGIFPRIDSESFISYEMAVEAARREIAPSGDPVIIGVDVARFGDDASVIYPRKGRDARTLKPEIIRSASTMDVATRAASAYLKYSASVVLVDSGGVGGGVVDRLRQLRIPVIEVDFGSGPQGLNPDDGTKYANKRAEIWGAMRTWLQRGAIPDMMTDDRVTLVDELVSPNFGINGREEIQLESKRDMRRRGVPSPNVADALACTFAFPVFEARDGEEGANKPYYAPDYNPYEQERIYA